MKHSALSIVVALAVMGCMRRGAVAPWVEAVSPSSGRVATGQLLEVTVRGRGFDSLNTVHFGAVVLSAVPRRSSTELRFVVPPDDTFLRNRGGAPPHPLPAGTYDVRVQTARGMSNGVPFVLSNSGAGA